MTRELSFLRGSRNVTIVLPCNFVINLHPLLIIVVVVILAHTVIIAIVVAIIYEFRRRYSRSFLLLLLGSGCWGRFFGHFIVVDDGVCGHLLLLGLLGRLRRALLLEEVRGGRGLLVLLLLGGELGCRCHVSHLGIDLGRGIGLLLRVVGGVASGSPRLLLLLSRAVVLGNGGR